MDIKTKRVYDPPSEEDGFRILVDRLWPRGLKREGVRLDLWLKEIAPGSELRRWFSHDPERWGEFKRRYFEELKDKKGLVDLVIEHASKGRVTLLYATRDRERNNAVALKEFIIEGGRKEAD